MDESVMGKRNAVRSLAMQRDMREQRQAQVEPDAGPEGKPPKSTQRRARRVPAEEFPSARYFQVHFEQLHEQLSLTTRQLVILSDRVQDLEREVNRLNEDPGPP
ncbi:hypothetical protein [Methylomonas koyamae]|uniref:hypothetical protein n=2 Tax=Methylomonas TaxID=416 RepID=UPI0016435BD4|nr:hypothetical protein [Methylomonas koyamae]